MSDDLGRDIVDGSIINWSKLSKEELENIIDVYKQKEKETLEKVDKELSMEDDEDQR